MAKISSIDGSSRSSCNQILQTDIADIQIYDLQHCAL